MGFLCLSSPKSAVPFLPLQKQYIFNWRFQHKNEIPQHVTFEQRRPFLHTEQLVGTPNITAILL